MKRTFIKGQQFSLPPVICRHNISSRPKAWSFAFTKELLYRFWDKKYDEDWRKLVGLKEDYLKPKYNSAMVGFRPAVDGSDRFELNAYHHIDGEAVYTKALMTIDPGQIGHVMLWVTNHTFEWRFYRDKNLVAVSRQETPVESKYMWEINPWYGGDAVLPFSASLYLTRLDHLPLTETNDLDFKALS